MFEMVLDRALGLFARFSERLAVWRKWPFLPAVAIILGHRVNLREHNLTDTESEPANPEPPEGFDVIGWRTADGSFNDLGKPWMGRAGARFGRNLPMADTYPPSQAELMEPSPRLISNRLLARREFVPVPHLNVLAAAWIQFMVHDWLSHGANDKENLLDVPVPEGDDWPGGRMQVPGTKPDQLPNDPADGLPPTFQNSETHWWDASQIYGSNEAMQRRVRTKPGAKNVLADGKLWLRPNGLLPIDEEAKREGQELAGVNGNWWIGLSVLHTLFAREHNAIVDRLRVDHPNKSGEWLFQKARLVNAALLAKIHTVEWTPALMDSPEGRMAMRGNYWGLKGEHISKMFGRASDSEVVSGIPGSPQAHHGVPYAMTEEFAATYRLHSLLPDEFRFHSHKDDALLYEADLPMVLECPH